MTTTQLSSDIYSISKYIDEIQKNFTENVSDDTLLLGMFGYLNEVHGNMFQNAITMASEYSNEAIPVKAKFEKNIITHALALGIEKINAKPSVMDIWLCLPEQYLLMNLKDETFIWDKEVKIMVGGYEFHTDYDIIVRRNKLYTGEYVYTAIYSMDGRNKVAEDIDSPYLPPVGRINTGSMTMIVLSCKIRQITHTKIYKKILTDNPLENKIINFSFDDQLAYFNLEAKEGDKTHYLTPVYDGLYDGFTDKEYCEYSYLDSTNIRVRFNRDSYEPRANTDVVINIYTTKGAIGNFKYKDDIPMSNVTSENYVYDRMFALIRPLDDSKNGSDRKTVEELKRLIPKEALSRGSITTSTDLNNFFNSINDSNCRLLFLEKINNQLERLYYSYILLKYENIVIPTNTLDVNVNKTLFNNIENNNCVLSPGNVIYYNGVNTEVKVNPTDEELLTMEKNGFVYINPFLCLVNKSPFFVSYLLTVFNKQKYLQFDYINNNSFMQFIASKLYTKRELFTDKDTYKFTLEFGQNINKDFGFVKKDDDGNIVKSNIKVVAVFKNSMESSNPYRYSIADIDSFDESGFIYKFTFNLKTKDIYDRNTRIKIDNCYDIGTNHISYGYFEDTCPMAIYTLVKLEEGEFGRYDLDRYVPGLEGYTLTNIYNVDGGVDFFYNYSNIIASYVNVSKNNNAFSYKIHKMPLIRKMYINTENRIQNFASKLEKQRSYIEYCLEVLEDSFGVDMKFFNTYGPSNLFSIEMDKLINRVNLSLTFRVEFKTVADRYLKDFIIADIKTYMEDLNDIRDLHIPNLITQLTNTYKQNIVFIEFVDFNGYGPGEQHIYREDNTNINNIVPEFLNVNTLSDDTPDITVIIV